MSDLTNFASNAIVQHFFRGTNVTGPTTLYVALASAAAAGEAGTFTEITGGSYARQTVTLAAPTNGVANVADNVSFPLANANYSANISHVFIMDDLTTGNAWAWKALGTPVQILTGDQFILNTATQLNVS